MPRPIRMSLCYSAISSVSPVFAQEPPHSWSSACWKLSTRISMRFAASSMCIKSRRSAMLIALPAVCIAPVFTMRTKSHGWHCVWWTFAPSTTPTTARRSGYILHLIISFLGHQTKINLSSADARWNSHRNRFGRSCWSQNAQILLVRSQCNHCQQIRIRKRWT